MGCNERRVHWPSGHYRFGLAAAYDNLLEAADVQRPELCDGDHVYHVYAVCIEGRDQIRDVLQSAGIATGIHYPLPVHMQPAYSELAVNSSGFPISERLARQFLSLPIYPEMTLHQVEIVADTFLQAIEGRHVQAA